MAQGKLISIEGTEGAGKSTALQLIKTYLESANIPVIITREPGGTRLAEDLRQLILHTQSSEKIQPETELLLMFAGRLQHIKHIIQPALNSGKWVVTDRYIDASYAYQGGGRNIDMDKIKLLDQWLCQPTYPSLTLLLDLPPEIGFERTEKRGNDKDRIEQEKIDFFVRVRNAYLERAKAYPERIKIIDASLSFDEVAKQIRDVLDKFLKV